MHVTLEQKVHSVHVFNIDSIFDTVVSQCPFSIDRVGFYIYLQYTRLFFFLL